MPPLARQVSRIKATTNHTKAQAMNPRNQALSPEQRLSNVGLGGEPLLAVYSTPAEAVADIRDLLVALKEARDERDAMQRRLHQIANAGDSISAEISTVLRRYSILLRSPESK